LPAPCVDSGVPACITALGRYVEAVLGYLQDWSHGRVAHEADPTSVIAAVAHADYLVACGKASKAVALLRDLESANAGLLDTSAASKAPQASYLRAWMQWLLEGDPRGGAETLMGHVVRHPDDLLAMKRAQLLAFIDGDAELMLAAVSHPDVLRANTGRPYFHGLRAFALEQCGRLEEAEAEGRRGTEVCSGDSWSHHAVAHSLYFQCRLEECAEWMLSLSSHWDKCMSFMLTHNWWHVALCRLEQGRFEEAMKLFDDRVWGVDRSYSEDQMGALGLLVKTQLHMFARALAPAGDGEDLSARAMAAWVASQTLARDQLHARVSDVLSATVESGVFRVRYSPLFDFLLLFSALQVSRWDVVTEVCSSCASVPASAASRRAESLRACYVPLLAAVLAVHAARDPAAAREEPSFVKAWEQMGELLPALSETSAAECGAVAAKICAALNADSRSTVLGGSAEQRDVVFEFCLATQLLAGQVEAARTILAARRKARPGIHTTETQWTALPPPSSVV